MEIEIIVISSFRIRNNNYVFCNIALIYIFQIVQFYYNLLFTNIPLTSQEFPDKIRQTYMYMHILLTAQTCCRIQSKLVVS